MPPTRRDLPSAPRSCALISDGVTKYTIACCIPREMRKAIAAKMITPPIRNLFLRTGVLVSRLKRGESSLGAACTRLQHEQITDEYCPDYAVSQRYKSPGSHLGGSFQHLVLDSLFGFPQAEAQGEQIKCEKHQGYNIDED